jgi:hypothetical protein
MVKSGELLALPGTQQNLRWGRVLCMARADAARCKEELQRLPSEFVRLSEWAGKMAERCDKAFPTAPDAQALVALRAVCVTSPGSLPVTSSAARWHVQQLNANPAWDWGRWYLVFRHKWWLKETHTAAAAAAAAAHLQAQKALSRQVS